MSKATEKAYSLIRENILSGHFAAGAHLKEGELVELCGVSRTPVRDALRQLATDRYVVIRRNQGVFVNEWSIDDINDIFDLRAILEALIAERAATRISDEALAELKSIHSAIQAMLEDNDQPQVEFFLSHNKRFHQILSEAAASRMLSDTLSQIVQPPLIAQTARQYSSDELQKSNDHHREMINAFEMRDGAWAALVMKTHIVAAQRKFMNSYRADTDDTSGS